jgi:hypothetical protein
LELALTLALAAVLGLVPATIARRKGRDFLAWWFFGMMLFVAALLMRPAGLGSTAQRP